jgi:hypothetical protein
MAEAAGRWQHQRQDQTSGIGVKDWQEEDLCRGCRPGYGTEDHVKAIERHLTPGDGERRWFFFGDASCRVVLSSSPAKLFRDKTEGDLGRRD